MGEVTTKTGVCNMAQVHLREKKVVDIENPTDKSERTYFAIYDAIRRLTLEAHPWNFASKRATVGGSATAPTHKWQYQSALLPDDFIRINTIGQNDDWNSESYTIENNRILSNSPAPYYIQYVYNFTDIPRMSPLFLYAFSLRLAAAAAYAITGNSSLKDSLLAEFDDIFTEGRSSDGQQRPPVRRQVSKWNRARGRLGRSTEAMNLGGE